jgi:hypothetical protein
VEFNPEIKPNQLTGPLVLGNGRQALIKQVFETEVVCLDHERAAPKIRSPVADYLDQPDELLFVGRQLGMAWRELLAVEDNRARAALNGEVLIKVRELDYRCRCQLALERPEHRLGLRGPLEPVFV